MKVDYYQMEHENDENTVDPELKRKRKRKRKESTIEDVPLTAVVDATTPSAFVNSQTVYIEGLPFTATDEDVQRAFAPCGKILSLRLPKWHDSGRLRGYGHIEFETVESANKAFELDGENPSHHCL